MTAKPAKTTELKEEVRGKNFRYFHPDCANTAFFLTHLPKKGEPINAQNVIKNDGSYPEPNDPIVCGSCGRDIPYLFVENVIPMA